jgi:hypothetical protein
VMEILGLSIPTCWLDVNFFVTVGHVPLPTWLDEDALPWQRIARESLVRIPYLSDGAERMQALTERFRQDICWLVPRAHGLDINYVGCHIRSKMMVFHVDVLRPWPYGGCLRLCQCTAVVFKQRTVDGGNQTLLPST